MVCTILIPVFNERRTVGAVLEKACRAELPEPFQREIVVIDDGSSDGTREILETYRGHPFVRVFHLSRNGGKSGALRHGIEHARGDIILIQDADEEYDPDDYPLLLEPFLDSDVAVVYGSRFKGGDCSIPHLNRWANQLSNLTLNLFHRSKLSDVHTGYKAFRKSVIDRIKITSNGFLVEPEVTIKFLRLGFKILEVPIRYRARSRKQGKKMTWIQALWLYWGIFRFSFSTVR